MRYPNERILTVIAGYTYDPGSSDLDNEQPIHVRMTLGDYRRAYHLQYELDRFDDPIEESRDQDHRSLESEQLRDEQELGKLWD